MALGENAESSLRDDLAKGLEEIQAREAAAEPNDEQSPAAQAQPEANAPETQADRGDGRDAHGKFVAKPKEGADPDHAPQAAPEAKPAVEGQTPEAEKQTEQPDGSDAPPKSWRADEAQAWKDVPTAAKAAILRREADAAKIAGQNDAERMFGREMADLYRPFMGELQQSGVSPQFATKVLLDNHAALRSNDPNVKNAKARELLLQYGIDPAQLVDQNAPQDPHLRQLQNEVIQLRSQLNRPAPASQYAPLPPSADEVNIHTEIERFRADPAHPHFDAVSQTMGRLIEAGAASDLETAYNMAVASDPALRSTVPAPQPTAANLQEKTAAARRAAASVTGSPGPSGNPKPNDLRAELEENARRLGFI